MFQRITSFLSDCCSRMWSGFYDFTVSSNEKIGQSSTNDSSKAVVGSATGAGGGGSGFELSSQANSAVAKMLHGVGKDLKIKGSYMSGSGIAYVKSKIEQDKLYYEVEVRDGKKVIAGVSNSVADESAGVTGHYIEVEAQKGDVLSITYDQANYPTLSMYINGTFHKDVTGMKGQVYTFVSLPELGEVAWRFDDVVKKKSNPVFQNFDQYMVARSVI